MLQPWPRPRRLVLLIYFCRWYYADGLCDIVSGLQSPFGFPHGGFDFATSFYTACVYVECNPHDRDEYELFLWALNEVGNLSRISRAYFEAVPKVIWSMF